MKKILNFKNILILFLFFIIGFLIFKNIHQEKELKSNYVILIDSLLDYKNKNKQLYKEKDSYILEIEELKKVNTSLYNECKNLKDNPIVVTEVVTEVQIKEVYIEKESVVDSLKNEIKSDYNYKDDYLSLKAFHNYNIKNNKGSLLITDINMNANIYTNIIEKDKKLQLISRTDNPYLQVTNINGGFINLDESKVLNNYFKRYNKWSLGISGGIYAIYSINSRKIEVGPGGGLSITYNFCSW